MLQQLLEMKKGPSVKCEVPEVTGAPSVPPALSGCLVHVWPPVAMTDVRVPGDTQKSFTVGEHRM